MSQTLGVIAVLFALWLIFAAGYQVGREQRRRIFDAGFCAGLARGYELMDIQGPPHLRLDPDVCIHPNVEGGVCTACGESGLPEW